MIKARECWVMDSECGNCFSMKWRKYE